MRIISIKKLRDFWNNQNHADSEQALRAWYAESVKSVWKTPQDIKRKYRSASVKWEFNDTPTLDVNHVDSILT